MIGWLRYPLVLIAAPIIGFLCSSWFLSAIQSYGISSGVVNGSHVQEIVALMDELYTVMADMTFIPASSIRRGPHTINVTAIPCEYDSTSIQLTRHLPYVDAIDLDPEDGMAKPWFFGGSFMDYRDSEALKAGCESIRGQTSSTVALTRNTTWERYKTSSWVMLYDHSRNAIRINTGDSWQTVHDVDQKDLEAKSFEVNDLLGHSMTKPLSLMDRSELDWKEWFHAPTLLRRIVKAYRTLEMIPWETSAVTNRWEINPELIRDSLRKNGWPERFDPNQFNADLIRIQYKSTGKGPAESAYERIEWFEGRSNGDRISTVGEIRRLQTLIQEHGKNALHAKDQDSRLFWEFRAQKTKWDLDDAQRNFEGAKEEYQRLCPEEPCISEGDIILWDFKKLEEVYKKSQRAKSPQKKCDWDLFDWYEYGNLPRDGPHYANCVSQRQQELDWLELAYTQAKAEAIQHCASTGCSLLPQPTLDELVRAKINSNKDEIERQLRRSVVVMEWKETLGNLDWESFERAHMEHSISYGLLVQGPAYMEEGIEWLEQQLAAENWAGLWACIDDGECLNGI